MKTIIEKISGNPERDNEIIARGAKILSHNGLVAFPTETVYGLGGNAMDPQAAEKIYAAKGRPSDNPLIIHIAETRDMEALSDQVPSKAYLLAEHFWPGPLTMILRKNSQVPLTVTGGLDTVAIRLPAHEVARKLIAASGTFIAAPSANLSGKPSPTDAAHVIEDLSGRVDMIIDDGSIEIGVESTIVDLTEDIPVILRPGYITINMLEEVIGEVRLDKALMSGVKADVKPKAPGMKYRHYAPQSELIILDGDHDQVVAAMQAFIDEGIREGRKVGVMISSELAPKLTQGEVIILGSSKDNGEIAKNLFAALREFDDRNVDVIYAEAFSQEGIGQAVMNRLIKAAGHKIIKV